MNLSILPADEYIVMNKSLLNDNDRLILSMLYQPIIGCISLSLYFTLWSDLDKSITVSKEYTHHHLMNTMGIRLEEIIEARKKLEAVGLLKTYYKDNTYIYEIHSPVLPMEFFSNPILSTSLYSMVGSEYKDLLSYYKVPTINYNEFKDISTHFSDMFDMDLSNMSSSDEKNIKTKDKLEIIIDNVVDFDFIIGSIPKGIINSRTFSPSIKKLINRLAYLYNFDNITMSNLIKDSINEKGMIVESELKKGCKNYYSFENNKTPKLIYKKEKAVSESNTRTNREKMIEVFETTSPYDFLKAKYKGAKPTSKDTNLIESLLTDQELNPGVVNVLIDYVLRTNDNKLNKNYVEAIASQWKISNIKTAKDAMKRAETEYKKVNKNKKSEEVLPSWYGKDIKKQEMSDNDIKELENMLSEFE